MSDAGGQHGEGVGGEGIPPTGPPDPVSGVSFRLLADSSPAGIYLFQNGKFRYVNAAMAELFGYSPEEIIDRLGPLDLTHPDDRERVTRLVGRRVNGESRTERYEFQGLRKDGEPFPLEAHGTTVDFGGAPAILGTLVDLARRRLRESEIRLRTSALEAVANAIVITDTKGVIVWVNDAFCDSSGWPREEVLGRTPAVLRSGVHDEVFYADLWSTIRSGRTWWGEMVNRRRDGTLYHEEMSITPVKDDAGRVSHYIAVKQDITVRRRMEERLRESESRYRSMVDGSPLGMFHLLPSGRFTSVNPAFVAMLRFPSADDVVATTSLASLCMDPRDAAGVLDELRTKGRLERKEVPFRSLDGRRVLVRLSARVSAGPAGVMEGGEFVAEDITERREMEQDLRQLQKTELLGQIAGGVAHDFNNLLTAILGYSELAEGVAGLPPNVLECLGEVKKAGEQARALTRQLLVFSRKQPVDVQEIDPSAIIEGSAKMMGRLVGETIELVLSLGSRGDKVKADPGQVEQIVLNLVVNGRDAMPRGGRIFIRTGTMEPDESFRRRHPEAGPVPHLFIEVRDEGSGIPPEVRDRIFEPFFTTKGSGRGTGLGLATVHRIVRSLGGGIEVESALHRGSTFRVFLPISAGVAVPAETPVPAEALGRGERVLVVEDDRGVRDLAQRFLEEGGYAVLCARDSDDAARSIAADDAPLHLVICDVVTPRGGAPRTVERIHELRPGVPILYVSGYSQEVLDGYLVSSGADAFLPKPFTRRTLLTKVRETLTRTRRNSTAGS